MVISEAILAIVNIIVILLAILRRLGRKRPMDVQAKYGHKTGMVILCQLFNVEAIKPNVKY